MTAIRVLPAFSHYGNRCLYDTVVSGLPAFFARYDARFAPQNTILTLDYPVLQDLSAYTGIDKIYEFIRCIHLEQKFLQAFPESDVIHILSNADRQYEEITENICEIVLVSVIGHILAEKPFAESDLEPADYLRIQEQLTQTDFADLCNRLENIVEELVLKYYDNDRNLSAYLSGALRDIALRLKNAGDHGGVCRFFGDRTHF